MNSPSIPVRNNIDYTVMALALAGAGVGLLVAGALIIALPAERQEELAVEVAKAGMGLVPVAFFGVIVASFVHDRDVRHANEIKLAEEEREQLRRLDDFRRRFLGDVVSAYNRVKSARRSFRAAGIDPQRQAAFGSKELEVFTAQFKVLMDAQLDLEELEREAESRGSSFSQSGPILAALKALQSYVNGIGEDEENQGTEIGLGTPMTRLSSWTHFAPFLRSVRKGGDFLNASTQVKAIEVAIWPDLVNPPSVPA